MQSSRDSSVWRSLAVAFGDGLAFGVGMKLTQNKVRPPAEALPELEANPLAERIDRIERRLERAERAPAPAPSAAVATDPIDQSVLDAMAHALEARLKELAGQVERRLADVEARITIELRALRQEDLAVSASARDRVAEVERQLHEQTATIRGVVSADMGAFAGEVARIVDDRVASAVSSRVQPIELQLRAEIQQAVARASSLSAAAAEASIEAKLAPLREQAAQKDREIAALRQRVAEADRAVVDVFTAIGQVCRNAAERMGAPQVPAVESVPPAESAAPPIIVAEAAAKTAVEERRSPPMVELAVSGSAAPVSAAPTPEPEEQPAPVHPGQSRLWRVPMVSSFLIAAGSLLVLHYL